MNAQVLLAPGGICCNEGGLGRCSLPSPCRRMNHCRRPPLCGLFAFAGLWERWNDPQGEVIESCSILTREANELMRPLHDCMAIILDAESDAR